MESAEFEILARKVLIYKISEYYQEDYWPEDIQMVWFAHVLGNKKAIFIDMGRNSRIYEVTYNAAKNEIYVDGYDKQFKVKVNPDEID